MAKNVYDLIAERFGVRVRDEVNPEVATVGAAVTTILKADSARLGFTIINLSVNSLHVAPSSTVSSTRGISVPPSGGHCRVVFDEDFGVVAREWTAIAGDAGSAIMVIANMIEAGEVA